MLKKYIEITKLKNEIDMIERFSKTSMHFFYVVFSVFLISIFLFFLNLPSYNLFYVFFIGFLFFGLIASLRRAKQRSNSFNAEKVKLENKLKEMNPSKYNVLNNIELYSKEIEKYYKKELDYNIPNKIIKEIEYAKNNEEKIFKEFCKLKEEKYSEEQEMKTIDELNLMGISILIGTLFTFFINLFFNANTWDNGILIVFSFFFSLISIVFSLSLYFTLKSNKRVKQIKKEPSFLKTEENIDYLINVLSRIEPEKIYKINKKTIDEIRSVKEAKENKDKSNKEKMEEIFLELNEENIQEI